MCTSELDKLLFSTNYVTVSRLRNTAWNSWNLALQIDTKEVTTSRRLVIDADVLITKKNKILGLFLSCSNNGINVNQGTP